MASTNPQAVLTQRSDDELTRHRCPARLLPRAPRRRPRPRPAEQAEALAAELAERPSCGSTTSATATTSASTRQLYRDHHLDVWLICWTGTQDTGLHDHDLSGGAVRMVEGELDEDRLRLGEGIDTTRYRAGDSFGFDASRIHDVRHAGGRADGVAAPVLAAAVADGPLPGGRSTATCRAARPAMSRSCGRLERLSLRADTSIGATFPSPGPGAACLPAHRLRHRRCGHARIHRSRPGDAMTTKQRFTAASPAVETYLQALALHRTAGRRSRSCRRPARTPTRARCRTCRPGSARLPIGALTMTAQAVQRARGGGGRGARIDAGTLRAAAAVDLDPARRPRHARRYAEGGWRVSADISDRHGVHVGHRACACSTCQPCSPASTRPSSTRRCRPPTRPARSCPTPTRWCPG